MTAKVTKTIKQALLYKPQHATWFAETQALFNRVVASYFEVIQAHPGVLDLPNKEALTALERLTHMTKGCPSPVMPLPAIVSDVPTVFRRAAINAALGAARSFSTHLARWRKRKEQAQARGKKYTIRPPVPPRRWNRSVTLYAGMYRERQTATVLLKLWTGNSWAWVKVRVSGRDLPDGWETGSPQLVHHGSHWRLHTPLERDVAHLKKVETQVRTIPTTNICAVDLNINEHLAVCTVQTVEGTVVATRFIGGGKQLHGLRKRQLGRIARNRSKTGIIAEGEQDNAHLWAKVRALDEDTAHQVSRRIVEFAKAYGATVLVFEHLGHFQPQKGKYSRRANEKRAYWLRGKIFHYAKYKAYHERIVTCRVNPRNTSREHVACGEPVARYDAGQPPEGYTPGAPLMYCPRCDARDNADRNASLVIGKRLLLKYRSQGKPRAPLATERPTKVGGVADSQAAQRKGRLSTDHAGHGVSNEQGTAQDTSPWDGRRHIGYSSSTTAVQRVVPTGHIHSERRVFRSARRSRSALAEARVSQQMQHQEQTIAGEESGYVSLSETEQEVGISRVTLRKYLGQLGIEPRSFGIGGRTLYISKDELERVKRLKHNPSLLESLKTR